MSIHTERNEDGPDEHDPDEHGPVRGDRCTAQTVNFHVRGTSLSLMQRDWSDDVDSMGMGMSVHRVTIPSLVRLSTARLRATNDRTSETITGLELEGASRPDGRRQFVARAARMPCTAALLHCCTGDLE